MQDIVMFFFLVLCAWKQELFYDVIILQVMQTGLILYSQGV
jgi:hypothetical protein